MTTDWPDKQWLRYRISDLKASLLAEEALGRNTGLVHAARRMIRFLEDQEEPVNKEYDNKVTSEDEKLNLSDWDKLNNEVTRLTQQVGDLQEAVELLTSAADRSNDRVTVLTGNGQVHDKHLLSLFEKVGTLTELVQTLEVGFNTEYKILHDDQKKLTDTLESQLDSIRELHDAAASHTRTLDYQNQALDAQGEKLDAHKDTLGTYGGILDGLLVKTKSHDRSVDNILNMVSSLNKSFNELQKKSVDPDVTLADKATVNPALKDATSRMLLKRFLAVQRICEASIDLDTNKDNPDVYPYRNRQWLAESILNILKGNVDE